MSLFLSRQTQSSELCSSFTLLSPHAILKLRFPIPDLRPLPKRRPPTQRAVRQETLVLELMELELKHQEAPDLQSEQTAPGQPWAPCLTQLLEASFTDLHGGNTHDFCTVLVCSQVVGYIDCMDSILTDYYYYSSTTHWKL